MGVGGDVRVLLADASGEQLAVIKTVAMMAGPGQQV